MHHIIYPGASVRACMGGGGGREGWRVRAVMRYGSADIIEENNNFLAKFSHPLYSMNNFVTNKSKLPQDGAQVFPYMGWLAIIVTW